MSERVRENAIGSVVERACVCQSTSRSQAIPDPDGVHDIADGHGELSAPSEAGGTTCPADPARTTCPADPARTTCPTDPARGQGLGSTPSEALGTTGPTVADPARVAVFDYDGTIIDTQSGLQFAKYLVTRGYINQRTFLKLAWWGFRYITHLPHGQDGVRELIISELDMSRPEVLRLMARFHDECLTRRYRVDALRRIRELKAEGYVTVLVSATFMGIATAAARFCDVDGYVATAMAVDANDHYTGEVAGEVIEGKGKVDGVTRWANEHFGAGRWVIEFAFGDHHSDEEILEMAAQPVCVDPGRTLRSIAKRRGWPIALWR